MSSFYIAGAPAAAGQGLKGSIGSIRLYSSAIPRPESLNLLYKMESSETPLASWGCLNSSGFTLTDEVGRNDGKLKQDPDWVLSPFDPDHRLSVYIGGKAVKTELLNDPDESLKRPAGEHSLLLGGNVLMDADGKLRRPQLGNFCGEFDEMRIWNVPRTRENFCDLMHTRLPEIPAEVAVYLPFDVPEDATSENPILDDASQNGWRLHVADAKVLTEAFSRAPIGVDAPCVAPALGLSASQIGVEMASGPSIGEYGDMQVSATGGFEGAFKRLYSYINPKGEWCLVTGFRIGTLITEWVSQVQTSPTLIGYIEGAPPIPLENFEEEGTDPESSIRFKKAESCTYEYSSRAETINKFELGVEGGIGVDWDVSAGLGVSTQISEGKLEAKSKTGLEISNGECGNAVSSATTNSDMEMGVKLTGSWVSRKAGDAKKFQPSNSGLALVESEVADVFALRLKIRGSEAPLVAYQMRPNPDIPKDRNLVSFEINPSYTKQGCLDGRFGLEDDENYPPTKIAPKNASYFKPAEAYALKDCIRRAEETRKGEYERYSATSPLGKKISGLLNGTGNTLPKRTQRNICNSYVWTADGGTYQETNSTMDMVQAEAGGNFDSSTSFGTGAGMELTFATATVTAGVDAAYSFHYNLSMTKSSTSETSFELEAEFPPSVDIRKYDEKTGKLIKRPGAVESYRWMSFYLDATTEATDIFFSQVIDPEWLAESPEPNAALLRTLDSSIKAEAGNARTKAWRVLHRCTYVNRVLPPARVKDRAVPGIQPTLKEEGKKSTLLADVSSNWALLQSLEPLVRDAGSRVELASKARSQIAELYPTLLAQPKLYAQILDLLGDFLGLP